MRHGNLRTAFLYFTVPVLPNQHNLRGYKVNSVPLVITEKKAELNNTESRLCCVENIVARFSLSFNTLIKIYKNRNYYLKKE